MVLLLVPFIAGATTFHAGETYMLSKDSPIRGDLYTAAGNITISSPINGDLLAAGGNVVVNARVSGDAAIVGGSIDILGVIGDDLRFAGGDIKIDQPINGDLIGFGGSLYLSPDVSVVGDAVFVGGLAQIEGRVNGDLQFIGEEVIISGIVQGNIDLEAEKITITDGTIVTGDLTYTSSKEADVSEGADIRGEIVFNERDGGVAPGEALSPGALFAVLSLAKLVVLLVSALILVLFVKALTQRIVRKGTESFGPELLWGIVSFIVIPVVSFVLLITFFGSVLGVIAGLFYIGALVVANIFAGLLFGALLEKVITKRTPSVGWQWSVLGIVALHLIGLIPVVGWAFKFVFLLTAFGVLVHLTYNYIQARR